MHNTIKTILTIGLILITTSTASAEAQKDNLVFNKKNKIGITYSENKLLDATELIKENRTNEAKKILKPLVEWLEEATEHHANLYQTLRKIEKAKAQADIEKDLALKSAVLRDKTMYQMALIFAKEGKKNQAVEYFVNIVRSQPRTELGFMAYEQLQKIGFTYKVQLKEPKEAEKEIE